ncbi:hypothetical protein [Mycolicibacterium gadium]|uniref:Uncharacterized protein n=1 Tax=Mycolicibacterium gadium TaxID=1794 RepID=A0ABT6GXX8_MYCGU|nr:hypothetical protein [Mycolicibacterium gadium]MDG5486341.1 hypothetical protein [Mycolicibacterium gadium]
MVELHPRLPAALSRGVEPPVVATHGPLLQPNEVTRLSAPAHYSRLVGGDGHFDRAGGTFFVNPLLMAGAMATQGAVNRGRRRRAEQDAQPSWRNHRPAAVLTTNLRLMCSRPDGGYTSFWYQDLAEFYPQPHARTLVMSFDEDHTSPLQLTGPATPAISLWAGHAIYGDAWREHPHLAALIPSEQDHHRDQEQPLTDGLTDQQRQWWTDQQQRRPHHRTRSANEQGLTR